MAEWRYGIRWDDWHAGGALYCCQEQFSLGGSRCTEPKDIHPPDFPKSLDIGLPDSSRIIDDPGRPKTNYFGGLEGGAFL
jgi:hypothetical protein